MKAQRRHELKENDLAHVLEVGRRYLDEHGGRIGLAVVIVVAVVAVTTLTVRSQTAAVEDNWRRQAELSYEDQEVGRESLAALVTMTRESTDQQFILRGLLEQGHQALRLAQKAIGGPDPELNEIAREAFVQLQTRFPENPLAIGNACLGLATVAENEFAIDGDPVHKAEAMKHLDAVVANAALDALPFKRWASERREAIDETFAHVSFKYPVVEDAPVEGDPIDADPADAP